LRGSSDAYLALFHRVLLRNVTTWAGDYRQVTAQIEFGRPVAAGDDVDVPTVVKRPGNPPAHVTWVVTTEAGDPKIVDIVIEGISMRLTQRGDYASFIERNNGDIDALIRALERQIDSG
jgi:phospholipid transport system substrate-binding protein